MKENSNFFQETQYLWENTFSLRLNAKKFFFIKCILTLLLASIWWSYICILNLTTNRIFFSKLINLCKFINKYQCLTFWAIKKKFIKILENIVKFGRKLKKNRQNWQKRRLSYACCGSTMWDILFLKVILNCQAYLFLNPDCW